MCKERKQWIKKGEDVGKGNGEMVGRRYHCFAEGLFDFVDTTYQALLYGRIFDLHRNGIYLRYIVEGQ